MKHLAVHSGNAALLAEIVRLLPSDGQTTTHVVPPGEDLLDVILFHIPDLVVLAFDEPTEDHVSLFQALAEDPFLSSVSFLVVSPDVERTIEAYRRFGIASFLGRSTLGRDLARAARMLLGGMDPLHGKEIVKTLTAISGELALPTDLFFAPYYAGFFSNYLYKEGHVGEAKKFAVHLALTELLVNAMEHGNAGISYEEKADWLANKGSIQSLVDERMANPPYAGRQVRLEYHISPARSTFRVTDEGDGFDTSKLRGVTPAGGLLSAHGRGIFMTRASVDSLVYNETGTSATIEVVHDGARERTIPAGFVDGDPRQLVAGEVVFREGDPSDRLYYVVSGKFDILVSGQRILTVTPSDVFIGEMSFLIGNHRTATVIATEPGKLVEISRSLFTHAMRNHPSHGIYLSKLLARRLMESNERYARLVPGSTGEGRL